MKLQLRTDEGERLTNRSVTEEDLETMREVVDELYDEHVSNRKLKVIDEFDALLDGEICQHEGDTYTDEGGWEFCDDCDELIPVDDE